MYVDRTMHAVASMFAPAMSAHLTPSTLNPETFVAVTPVCLTSSTAWYQVRSVRCHQFSPSTLVHRVMFAVGDSAMDVEVAVVVRVDADQGLAKTAVSSRHHQRLLSPHRQLQLQAHH